VRAQIARLVGLVEGAETGQRGYLITGKADYLAPYNQAFADLPAAIEALATLVADNPRQQQAVGQVRQLIIDKQRELRGTVEDYDAGRRDAALAIVNSDVGRQIMENIRRVLSAMEADEDRLLAIRRASAEASGTWLEAGAASVFVLICTVGLLILYVTRRSFADLSRAHDELAGTNRELIDQIGRREQAEGQLRQAQKMEAIGQLTGGIAHDFNNMLGVIIGSLELMERRIRRGDVSVERFLQSAIQGAQRAAALTHRLLAFARQQPLAPEPVDANRLIAAMSDLMRSTLGEHIHVETVVAGGLWTTLVDPHQLESAVLNVAINARDAMPEGGRLTIETGNAFLDDAYCRAHADLEPGQFVMVAVSDTGVGMPPQVVARAYDPFFTTKPPGKGTGLGLSQVYGFVKQSRGHIKIYSEVGAGTTVKIYLPRLVGETSEFVRSSAQAVPRTTNGETVLVVEDDDSVRSFVAEALRELGYAVVEADGAAVAMNVLDSRSDIVLLLTDVVMPEVSGKSLADAALRRQPGLRVLFTTGYTPNAVVHGGVLDPGVHLLSKPFTIEQLAAKVRAILDA